MTLPETPTVSTDAVLDEETLRRIRTLHLRMGAQVTEIVAGSYRSAFRGTGIEFEELRPYLPGDPVRSIDWKVTARHSSAFIKLFREERELTVLLVVDTSPSMLFGTRRMLKSDAAAEAAAVLSFAACRNRDKVGLITFGRTPLFIPPRRGEGHVWHILRSVLAPPKRGRSSLTQGLESAARNQGRRAALFVVSDFLDSGWEQALAHLARSHDTTALVVGDPAELELPDAGRLMLAGSESGGRIPVHAGSPSHRAVHRRQALAFLRQRDEAIARCGVRRVSLDTEHSVLDTLVAYFRRRTGR